MRCAPWNTVQIYRLVMDLLDQIVELIGDEPVKMEEFYQILEAGLSEIQVGTIPQNVDRVVAGDMERTRLTQVKALFFIGVNDGYIPKAAQSGGLLSDVDREFLPGSGMELAPTPRQQMYMQRLYLYMNHDEALGSPVPFLRQNERGGKGPAPFLPYFHGEKAVSLPRRPASGGGFGDRSGAVLKGRPGHAGAGTPSLCGRKTELGK